MLADIDLGEETESDEEAQQDGAQQTQGAQRRSGAQRRKGAQRREGVQREDGAHHTQQLQHPPIDPLADTDLYCEWLEEHAKWAHPGDTKMREIIQYYPHLFSHRL